MKFKLEDFRVLCAWCNTVIRAPLRATCDEVPESHGVCRQCALNMGLPPHLIQDHAVAA